MPKPSHRMGHGSPAEWCPGYQAMDWQGALVSTPCGPAVQAGDYYYDAQRGVAVLIHRRPGMVDLWPFYEELADHGEALLEEIDALWSEMRKLQRQGTDGAQWLQLLMRGLRAETRLGIVRRVYEDPGLHCLVDVSEALAFYGYDEALEVLAEEGPMKEVAEYPFHSLLRAMASHASHAPYLTVRPRPSGAVSR